MKDIILTIACVCVLFLAGCGHSGNFTASGKVLQLGTPEFGMTYVNGLMTVIGSRGNTESVVEFNDDDGITGGPTADLKSVRTIRYKTGIQLDGYAVDLAKKCPNAVIEYVKIMPKLNTPSNWESKETLPKKSAGEKSTSDSYIDYLKAKLASISGGASMPTLSEIKGDGEYNNLYTDRSLTAQAALTAELLKYADDEGKMEGTGETYKDTLVAYSGRLAQLKAKGKNEATKITLGKAIIKGGKLVYLMYRLKEDDGSFRDEECPSCFELEE